MSAASNGRPAYAELPDGCAWDVLDPDLGSLSLLTADRVAAAARLVRTGKRFSLDLPIDQPNPPFFGREPVQHTVFDYSETILDDRLDSFFPQGSTQWDAFSHFAHSARGFFGGNDKTTIRERGALEHRRLASVRHRRARRAARRRAPSRHRGRLAVHGHARHARRDRGRARRGGAHRRRALRPRGVDRLVPLARPSGP